MTDDPLSLDPETMHRLGYLTVDRLVEEISRLSERPVLRTASPDEMRRRLSEPPPTAPETMEHILQRLRDDVLAFTARWDHPRLFAYVPGSGTWPAALADFIVAAWNVDASMWREASGPSQVELTVLDWFKEWIGYPPEAAGVFVSGGSAANMTAIACAREALLGPMSDRVILYASDQAHSSVARAARILGFRPEQVRVLPTDDRFRMRPETLDAAIDADLAIGLRPLIVVAAAGSTSTGAVDPMPELAKVCRARGVWLHVDAAYGGFVTLTQRGRSLLEGIDQADSVTLDPHKWLYQPFECGCLLVREGRQLREAFQIVPDYLRDSLATPDVNFTDLGMQLTRTARATKVWVSLKYFGVDAFRSAIERSMDLAVLAQHRIEESDDLELLTPASLGVVTFRRRSANEEDEIQIERLNAEVVRLLAADGFGLVSSTRLRGRYAIRLCVLNHTTSEDDVLQVLDRIERTPVDVDVATGFEAMEREREPGVRQPWLARPRIDADSLRTLQLFGSISADSALNVLSEAEERTVVAGEDIIRQWQYAREFYVILQGSAEVRSGDRTIAELTSGNFFGEFGALDWGAGFGYARTASVTATSQIRLLVLPGETLDRLVRENPGVAEEIHRAQRERMQWT